MRACPRNTALPSIERWTRIGLLLLAGLCATPVAAGTFQWVGADGSVHFADHAGDAPLHTARVEDVPGAAGASTWNRVGLSADGAGTANAPAAPAVRHVVPLVGAGLQLRVEVELNGSLRVPFIIDTGSMASAIPRSTLEALGLEVDAATPRVRVRGANGRVEAAPLVAIADVNVGGARAADVEMVISDALETGLLGMSFFQHFRATTDPRTRTLTLEPLYTGDPAAPRRQSLLRYRLDWGAVAGAAAYEIEISRDADFHQLVDRGSVRGTTADLSSLVEVRLAAGRYFWRVAAVSDRGARGPWSAARPIDFR